MNIVDFASDLLLAIEILGIEGKGFPQSKVRHTVSMAYPLLSSDTVDWFAECIVLALLSTGLVYQDNGMLYHMVQGGTPVAQYNPDDVNVN